MISLHFISFVKIGPGARKVAHRCSSHSLGRDCSVQGGPTPSGTTAAALGGFSRTTGCVVQRAFYATVNLSTKLQEVNDDEPQL